MGKLNIVSVGVEIPGLSDNCKSIDSMDSLSSYDIIVFQPQLPSLYPSDYIEFSNGGRAIKGSEYKEIKKITDHWFAELSDALKYKKTVIILTQPNKEIRYTTGSTSQRKGEISFNTSLNHLYNCLLPYSPNVRETRGNEISINKNELSVLVKQLYESCRTQTAYEVIFTDIDQSCQPLLVTKSNQIVGFIKKYKSGGNIIFWPKINFEYKGSSFQKDRKWFWTDEASAMGKAFTAAIVSLHKSLYNLQEPAPTWISVETYMTDIEKDILIKIQKNKDKQQKLNTEAAKLHEKIEQEQKLKYLLYAQGKELEDAVNYALGILGLKTENYHFKTKDLEIDNLIDYKGSKIIGETEGKDNDAIAVGKIRQLVINRDEYYMEETDKLPMEPKGILFGNPERQKPPAERTLDFTDACKQISVSKKIALVKTQDLFDVALYLKNNPNQKDFANICIEAMVNTEFGIVQFPKPG